MRNHLINLSTSTSSSFHSLAQATVPRLSARSLAQSMQQVEEAIKEGPVALALLVTHNEDVVIIMVTRSVCHHAVLKHMLDFLSNNRSLQMALVRSVQKPSRISQNFPATVTVSPLHVVDHVHNFLHFYYALSLQSSLLVTS